MYLIGGSSKGRIGYALNVGKVAQSGKSVGLKNRRLPVRFGLLPQSIFNMQKHEIIQKVADSKKLTGIDRFNFCAKCNADEVYYQAQCGAYEQLFNIKISPERK